MKINFEDYVTQLAPSMAAAEKPRWFLLTCMDYRYAHRIIDLMDSKGLRGKYDIFVLAGAAAGAVKEERWRETFVSHVKTARSLTPPHPIDRIMILEHRDCGAYTEFFGLKWADVKPPIETDKHLEQVRLLIPLLKNELQDPRYPELKIDSFLLARDEDDELVIEGPRHS